MDIQTFSSGSSGNCTLVCHGNTNILIDAGISLRRITQYLKMRGLTLADIDGILITHEHSDHVRALPNLIKRYDTPIYTTPGTASELVRMTLLPEGRVSFISAKQSFEIGTLSVTAFRTPHDVRESVGFRVSGGGRTLTYATDIGKVTREILDAAMGADTVVLEANHDLEMLENGRYPYMTKQRIKSDYGHLSNKRCGEFAAYLAENGTARVILAHLSRENNTPELAYSSVRAALGEKAERVELCVAPADCPGSTYII